MRYLLRTSAFLLAALLTTAATAQVPLSAADAPAAEIFRQNSPTSLTLVVVRNNEVHFQSFGAIAPGSPEKPTPDSIVRLCSLTKIFATDLLIKLAADKTVRLDTPLQSLFESRVPGPADRPITLGDLATHTSGLPREETPTPPGSAHFTFPSFEQRWAWLPRQHLKTIPGDAALYSNIGFDLLGDALAAAAKKPYPQLLAERTTTPLGMHDTTFIPTPAQCARLLLGFHSSQHPDGCTPTYQSAGSSGLYSTPRDIAQWLQYLLGTAAIRQPAAAQAPYLDPLGLNSVKGLDHAGTPTGIGLGWMILNQSPAQTQAPDTIIEKTGGGGGFTTYIALSPLQHTAIFMVLTENNLPWHVNPFREANNILLGLSGLPPMPPEPEKPAPAPRSRTRHMTKSKAATRTKTAAGKAKATTVKRKPRH